jgi:hypothetical protein
MVWWLCKYGHQWFATVISRTRDGGSGCPGCRFDDQLQRRRDQGKLRPVDRALLAVKNPIPRRRVGKPIAGPKAMLGFAKTFRSPKRTADWMKDLRAGEKSR